MNKCPFHFLQIKFLESEIFSHPSLFPLIKQLFLLDIFIAWPVEIVLLRKFKPLFTNFTLCITVTFPEFREIVTCGTNESCISQYFIKTLNFPVDFYEVSMVTKLEKNSCLRRKIYRYIIMPASFY